MSETQALSQALPRLPSRKRIWLEDRMNDSRGVYDRCVPATTRFSDGEQVGIRWDAVPFSGSSVWVRRQSCGVALPLAWSHGSWAA